MPKPGFKSITVSENVYKKFFKVYERNGCVEIIVT
jgi:hypothetical protein